jgi:hypothetical protein
MFTHTLFRLCCLTLLGVVPLVHGEVVKLTAANFDRKTESGTWLVKL